MNNQNMLLVLLLLCMLVCVPKLDSDDSTKKKLNPLLLVGGIIVVCILFGAFPGNSCNSYQPFSNIVSSAEQNQCLKPGQYMGTNVNNVPLSNVGDCANPESDNVVMQPIQPQRNYLDVSMTKDKVPGSGVEYNNISNYDGLCITTGNTFPWKGGPNNPKLISDETLYTVMGYDTSLFPVKSDPSSSSGPRVNATDGPQKLFMLANNTSSPYCNSVYSTSTGQLCMTDNQLQFVAARGGNTGLTKGNDQI
jgi:hypothetical protein